MTRLALCFPGQGSQSAGMAGGLLDDPAADALIAAAGEEGLDLRPALAGDDGALRPTEVAQPALLLVESVLASLLDPGQEVVAVAGHSVGEYAALVAAGALRPDDAMRLVVARGRAMAAMREGAMAALLGTDAAAAEEICSAVEQRGLGPVVVANLNAPGQVVVSGTSQGVDAAVEEAKRRGARRAVPLNVSGAFHSPLMEQAAEQVGRLIDEVDMADPRVPVACNVDGTLVREADGLRSRLRRQLTSPVRWEDCVRAVAALGVTALVELGPGSVLTGLARRIAPEVSALSASSAAEVASLPERLAHAARA